MKLTSPIILSLLSACILSLSWPAIGGITPLVFLAFVPLLQLSTQLIESKTGAFKSFLYIFLSFFVWNLCSSYWLFCVEGGFATKFFAGFMPSLINGLWFTTPFYLFHSIKSKFRTPWINWLAPCLWITMEYIHMHWDLTWPWFTLGNVFANDVVWIQWYEFTGVFGGTLWIWALNILLFALLNNSQTKQFKLILTRSALVLVLPMLLSIALWYTHEEKGPSVEVAVVQPNIDPYTEKFSLGFESQLNTMLNQATQVISDSTSLILFPETALQERSILNLDLNGNLVLAGLWENNIQAAQSVAIIKNYLSKYPNTSILTGLSSDSLFKTSIPPTITARALEGYNSYYDSYNAAMLLTTDTLGIYHKSKLVPGVEMLPFASVIKPILGAAILDFGGTSGGLATQQFRTVFTCKDQRIKAAPVICYESIYGEYLGEYMANGANLICIITNDAWWQNTAGHKQHLAYARLRAIEHRKSIARSANTGISAFINQRGEILKQSKYSEATALKQSIQLNDEKTFYAYTGDYIAKLSIVFSFIIILYTWYKRLFAK